MFVFAVHHILAYLPFPFSGILPFELPISWENVSLKNDGCTDNSTIKLVGRWHGYATNATLHRKRRHLRPIKRLDHQRQSRFVPSRSLAHPILAIASMCCRKVHDFVRGAKISNFSS